MRVQGRTMRVDLLVGTDGGRDAILLFVVVEHQYAARSAHWRQCVWRCVGDVLDREMRRGAFGYTMPRALGYAPRATRCVIALVGGCCASGVVPGWRSGLVRYDEGLPSI